MDEQDLPIDIHVGKLSDWLVSRRHVNKDWPKVVFKIREKISNAIHDMPEHPEVTKLLSGAYINYFHCLKIVDILHETEKDSKNFFGWYTSQRMKDWQEIANMYGKNNVYLAEAAQFLVRNVVYEIPSFKKQIASSIQIQVQCDKKQDETLKNISVAKERFYATCKQMGIKGDNVRQELVSLAGGMTKNFEDVAVLSRDLQEAVDFYSDFVTFTIPSSKSEYLPLLNFIIERGDVTTYEWNHNEAPLSIEKTELSFTSVEDEGNQDEGIDFGDSDTAEDKIDFDDSDTGGVDWCNLDSNENGQQINWEVEEGPTGETIDIVIESSGMAGGVAKGDEALSLLSNIKSRNQFINELRELQGFLNHRKIELGAEENLLSMTQFSTAPKRVQYHNAEIIQGYLSIITQIITALTSTKMQHLYLISTSSRYVDRFAESLTSRLKEADKMLSSITGLEQKRKSAIKVQGTLTHKLDVIIERTLELQIDLQREISNMYKNRPVNLMGKIIPK